MKLGPLGFAVIVNYADSAAANEEAVNETTGAGGHAYAVQANVASATDVRQLFDEAETRFGGVDAMNPFV